MESANKQNEMNLGTENTICTDTMFADFESDALELDILKAWDNRDFNAVCFSF